MGISNAAVKYILLNIVFFLLWLVVSFIFSTVTAYTNPVFYDLFIQNGLDTAVLDQNTAWINDFAFYWNLAPIAFAVASAIWLLTKTNEQESNRYIDFWGWGD